MTALRDNVLLRVKDLEVTYSLDNKATAHAVSDMSFDVAEGETLGLVGESGCGKSTVAKTIVRLLKPDSGSIIFQGKDLATLEGEELRQVRPDLQMIFQDPISSLNPRRRVRNCIAEGLRIWQDLSPDDLTTRTDELMTAVGIDPSLGDRRPHEFSGGQCQRIGIARALAVEPKLLICDEPVSALDVSIQAQILNLLQDLKQRLGLTMLFISHDLAVVKSISDRILVMYLGKECEIGSTDAIYHRPAHPYTRALLAAVPEPADSVDVAEGRLSGELPSATDPPSGCRFHTRCSHATDVCREVEPTMTSVNIEHRDIEHRDRKHSDHYVACHHPVLS